MPKVSWNDEFWPTMRPTTCCNPKPWCALEMLRTAPGAVRAVLADGVLHMRVTEVEPRDDIA